MKTTRNGKLSLSRSTLRTLSAQKLTMAGMKGTGTCGVYTDNCASQPGTTGCVTAAYSNCALTTCYL